MLSLWCVLNRTAAQRVRSISSCSQCFKYSTSTKSSLLNLSHNELNENSETNKEAPKPDRNNGALNLEQVAIPDLKFSESGLEFRGLDTDFPCLLKQ